MMVVGAKVASRLQGKRPHGRRVAAFAARVERLKGIT